MKTLIIAPGTEQTTDSVFALIDPETGECLDKHLSSDYHWAYYDLFQNSPQRDDYYQRFGTDLCVNFVDQSGYTIEDLLEKNHNFIRTTNE